MTVGRFVSRASSTAQFTLTVVVPAPPLAPKKTSVTDGGFAEALAVSRRVAMRRTAPSNESSGTGHMKNSLAPARIAWRISSGSVVCATAKIAVVVCAARRRSIAAMPEAASPRMSTVTTSGDVCSAPWRSSITPMGTPLGRSRRPIVRRNSSSCETTSAASWAMGSYSTRRMAFGNAPVGAEP